MTSKNNIGSLAKVGIIYNICSRLFSTFFQFLGIIVLARLLSPEDFGLIALGMLIVGFATRFGEIGFSAGLIQRKEEIYEKHINTLFVLDFILKSLLCAIIIFSAPVIAKFFNEPKLENVLHFVSFYMVLQCFLSTPLTVLKRKMLYKDYAFIVLIERLITISTGIVLALCGFGYWSIVYNKIVGISVTALIAAKKVKWRPRLEYDHDVSKQLFGFGLMVSLRSLLRYGGETVGSFFVSTTLGIQQLGFYEKAFEIIKIPQKRISTSINNVVFSMFSRIQDDHGRIKSVFRKLVLATSLLSYPILLGVAFTAPIFVTLVLGEQWNPTIFPLQIMCLAGTLRSIDPFLNSVLTATGHVKLTVFRRGVELILLGASVSYAVRFGINGVSIAVVVVAVIVAILMVNLVASASEICWRDYWEPQVPGFVASFGMIGILHFSSVGLRNYIDPLSLSMLVLQIIIGVVSYISLHLFFRFKEVVFLLSELGGDWKKVRGNIREKIVVRKSKIL